MTLIDSKYQLGRSIGRGGMAEVFEGELHGALGFKRKVAVKRMRGASDSDEEFAKLFVQEAKVASTLSHPNIVSVLDFAKDEKGRFVLVMEFIHGMDLRRLLQGGRLDISETLFILKNILRALVYAHHPETQSARPALVHRDVSPHNVMLSWSGAVKLVDFGIAKAIVTTALSKSGALHGKVSYMSPEQAHGDPVDGRSDLFSVGVVAHEMLTGRRLFKGSTDAETLTRMLNSPVVPPSELNPAVPKALDQIILRSLERDVSKRYRSAQHFQDDIESLGIELQGGAQALQSLLKKRFPDEAPQNSLLLERLTPAPGDESKGGDVPLASNLSSVLATVTRSHVPAPGLGQPLNVPSQARPPARVRGVPTVAVVASLLAAALLAFAIWMTQGRETRARVQDQYDASTSESDPQSDASMTASPPQTQPKPKPKPESKPKFSSDTKSPLDQTTQADLRPHASGAVKKSQGEKPAPTAVLEVKATPWANIFIRGRNIGQTPKTITLPVGPQTVRLVNKELGIDKKYRVVVKAGRQNVLTERFE